MYFKITLNMTNFKPFYHLKIERVNIFLKSEIRFFIKLLKPGRQFNKDTYCISKYFVSRVRIKSKIAEMIRTLGKMSI